MSKEQILQQELSWRRYAGSEVWWLAIRCMECVWLILVIILNNLYLENYLCSAAHITGQCQTMLLFNGDSSGKMWLQSLLEWIMHYWKLWLIQVIGWPRNMQRSRMSLLAIELLCWSYLERCLDVTVNQLLCIVEAIFADLGSFHVLKGSGRTPVLFFFSSFFFPIFSFFPKTYLKCEISSLQEDEFCCSCLTP